MIADAAGVLLVLTVRLAPVHLLTFVDARLVAGAGQLVDPDRRVRLGVVGSLAPGRRLFVETGQRTPDGQGKHPRCIASYASCTTIPRLMYSKQRLCIRRQTPSVQQVTPLYNKATLSVKQATTLYSETTTNVQQAVLVQDNYAKCAANYDLVQQGHTQLTTSYNLVQDNYAKLYNKQRPCTRPRPVVSKVLSASNDLVQLVFVNLKANNTFLYQNQPLCKRKKLPDYQLASKSL